MANTTSFNGVSVRGVLSDLLNRPGLVPPPLAGLIGMCYACVCANACMFMHVHDDISEQAWVTMLFFIPMVCTLFFWALMYTAPRLWRAF